MDEKIREQLISTLQGRGAHISFTDAVEDFPLNMAGEKVSNLDHTAWGLVYHIWIAQKDILEFSRSAEHQSPEYPHGYWPDSLEPGSADEWSSTIKNIARDLDAMIDLLKDPSRELFEPFPWGDGQTLFREALILADHNSYHTGQLVDIRMLLEVPVKDW